MGWEYWIDIRQPHPPPPCYSFHYHNSNTRLVARKVMVDLNWEKENLLSKGFRESTRFLQ